MEGCNIPHSVWFQTQGCLKGKSVLKKQHLILLQGENNERMMETFYSKWVKSNTLEIFLFWHVYKRQKVNI